MGAKIKKPNITLGKIKEENSLWHQNSYQIYQI